MVSGTRDVTMQQFYYHVGPDSPHRSQHQFFPAPSTAFDPRGPRTTNTATSEGNLRPPGASSYFHRTGNGDADSSDHSHLSRFSSPLEATLLPANGGGVWVGANMGPRGAAARASYDSSQIDPEIDDHIHNPSPHDSLLDSRSCSVFSARGWLNMGALVLLTVGLLTLFGGYPVISYYSSHTWLQDIGWNIGGVNATGQVPDIPGLPGLIDATTPSAAMTRTGFDGKEYNLVFSDEFNTDGRTFWPGDDPWWEAVDLHYWATGDYEWYDPDAATTKDGNLVLTVTEEPIHDLNFRSGMIQSWNKLCFTGGYIEVSVSLPGSHDVPGLWPGAWTMGNLGRAGFGATTEGLWPYSYGSCDVGTFPNQTNVDGTTPSAALTSGTGPGGTLSYLPGQRMSACTCNGEDHAGPSVNVGRGSPEIDILEAQVSEGPNGYYGQVSQSAQFAPFDDGFHWNDAAPATVVYNETLTHINSYRGGIWQQASSAVSDTEPTAYTGNGGSFQKFGFEYTPGANGDITWSVADAATWKMTAAAVGPNANVDVGQRLISEEPMYVILNLGISASFQNINWADLVFPSRMLVDYVRIYQVAGEENIGCNPKSHPTADYIDKHMNAYTNPNLTTWTQAGYPLFYLLQDLQGMLTA